VIVNPHGGGLRPLLLIGDALAAEKRHAVTLETQPLKIDWIRREYYAGQDAVP
jgi:hypothetical protein